MATISTEGWPVQILPLISSAKFPISLSGHMILVFKDDDGNEYQINAGPNNESFPYGKLILRDIGSTLDNRYNVVDGTKVTADWRGNTKIDFGGRNAEDVWDILLQHAENIDDAAFKYGAFSKNSNSVIATLLDVVGLDINDFLPDPKGVMLSAYIGKDTYLDFDFSLTGTDAGDFLRGRKGEQTFIGMDGDDRLIGGWGNDTLYGKADNDRLIGGRGKDLLIGGAGKDNLDGDQGADKLLGGAGADALFGRKGSDILQGGFGADKLVGGEGDDDLIGGAGADTLKGGADDDVLDGGAGVDRLRGDQGHDTFVFKNASDSGVGAEADKVLDFQSGEDTIDIAGLADGFVFAEDGLTGNDASFTLEEEGGNTRVQIDVDADGAADMEIVLKDTLGIGEDDFIF